MNGDDGFDTLTSQNGSSVIISGGADADTLLQSGGTSIVLTGDDGLDVLTSDKGIDISMLGGTGRDSLIESGGKEVTMRGGADADSLVSSGGTQITLGGDEGDDQITVKDSVDDTVAGGTGSDTVVLAGSSLGTVIIDEVAGPSPDLSRDTLDFSGFIGGPINLNLAVTTPQTVTPGHLTLILTDAAGIENVIGTAFADTILGNGRDNLLLGGRSSEPAGRCRPRLGRRHAGRFPRLHHVYGYRSCHGPGRARLHPGRAGRDPGPDRGRLHWAGPGEPVVPLPVHTDSAGGRAVRTTEFQPDPEQPGRPGQVTGGFANELDFRNLNLGTDADPSFASIQVNGILGVTGQPPDTSANWVALSAKIAAHELGHLVGLLHTGLVRADRVRAARPAGRGPVQPGLHGYSGRVRDVRPPDEFARGPCGRTGSTTCAICTSASAKRSS